MRMGSGNFFGRLSPRVGRATMLGIVGGGTVVGVIGTIDSPVVGTFFGVLYGAVIGAMSGVVDGVLLTWLVGWTRSRWAVFLTSALVWFLTFGVAIALTVLNKSIGQLIVVLVSVLLGAGAGPIIAFGDDPVVPAGPFTGVSLSRLTLRLLTWGASGGAAVGAVVGLVIGIRVYAPTSPVAFVEGAVLGSVNGAVLSVLLGGITVLPRMWIHR